MGIRRRKLTNAELASKKSRLNPNMKKAKAEAKYWKNRVFTEEEKKQIRITKAKTAALKRAKAVQKNRVKKASTRVVKKSKGYA